MSIRKQQVEELLKYLQSMRRGMGSPRFVHSGSITGAQWAVLAALSQRGNLTVKEVAADLRISSSAATQLVDALVKGGHVIRVQSKKDRRAVELNLSKKTARQMSRLRNEITTRFVHIFSVLNDAEFKRYVALNKKISDAVSEKYQRRTDH